MQMLSFLESKRAPQKSVAHNNIHLNAFLVSSNTNQPVWMVTTH